MFNVTKSAAPATPFTYQDELVVQQIKDDFFDKCYLCEEKVPRHLEVEHFYPQLHFPLLINNWNNLICICEKCNKIRPKNINTVGQEVYDPCTHDVDNFIKLKFNDSQEIDINIVDTTNPLDVNTKALLDRIHNGIGSKSLSYKDLRKLIINEVAEFELAIENYFTTNIKDGYRVLIKKYLSNKSAFTAFKRWIVRDNPKYSVEFLVLFD